MTKRKRPKLKPLKLSDKDLDEMAEVTEQDIIAANAEWREHAKADELLESAPEEQDEENADSP